MLEENSSYNQNTPQLTPKTQQLTPKNQQLTPKNQQLTPKKYNKLTTTCAICGIYFSKRCNLLRHQRNACEPIQNLSSISEPNVVDINIQSQSIVTEPVCPMYACKHCDKPYKHTSSLYRHESKCVSDNTNGMQKLVGLLNTQLEEQRVQIQKQNEQIQQQAEQMQQQMQQQLREERAEHSKQIQKQNKQIQALIKKVGITNNIGTINNNVLLSHHDTSIEHLTNRDYMECINRVINCIPQLIEKVHFDPKIPQNHNIYISNIKNGYVMVYNGSKWMLTDRNRAITDLIDDGERMVCDKLGEWEGNGRKIHPIAMEKFNRYLDKKEDDQILNDIKNSIKLILFNNRDMVNARELDQLEEGEMI